MKRLTFSMLTCTGLALGTQAVAQDIYVAATLGYGSPNSTVFNDGTNGAGNPEADIDSAATFGLAVGWMATSALRIELEYNRSSFDTDPTQASGTGTRALDTFGTDATMDVNSVMLNASYEFDMASDFRPFVMAGVGRTSYDMDGALFVSSNGGNTFGGFLPATFDYSGSGEDTAFQIGVGTAYDVAENTELTIEYRYRDLGSVSTGFDVNGDRLQTDLTSHNILVGLRYSFN